MSMAPFRLLSISKIFPLLKTDFPMVYRRFTNSAAPSALIPAFLLKQHSYGIRPYALSIYAAYP